LFDADHSGTITWEEFSNAMVELLSAPKPTHSGSEKLEKKKSKK
jgi:hypothetical protein